MIDRINPMSKLLDALKVSRSAETGKVGNVTPKRQKPEPQRDGFDSEKWASLRSEISQSLTNVDLDQRQEVVQASKSVIRSILRFQWGQAVVQEPQFVAMIENMERKIQKSEALQDKFGDLLKDFKNQ